MHLLNRTTKFFSKEYPFSAIIFAFQLTASLQHKPLVGFTVALSPVC